MEKNYKFLIIILAFASILMFTNLGDRALWGDEAQTSLVAVNTLEFGIPKMDNNRIFLGRNSDGSAQIHPNPIINKDNLWTYSPWGEFYLIASSLAVFGQTDFSARLPFAILGILSIILLYFLAIKLTNKETANLSIFLLALYIPFYLYSRQARYHSATMFLALLTIYIYLFFIENKRWSLPLLTLSLVISFYIHYVLFFALYIAVIFHFIIFRLNKKLLASPKELIKDKTLQKLLVASVVIFCLTFPWFVYANTASQASSAFSILHILTSTIYSLAYLLLYTIPLVLLIPFVLKKPGKSSTLIFIIIISACIMNALTPDYIPAFRYITFVFPFSMILISQSILFIKKYSKLAASITILLLVFTNILFILPFKPLEPIGLKLTEENSSSNSFIKDNLKLNYFLFDHLYEITHHYSTPEEKICAYLKEQGNEDDLILSNPSSLLCTFPNNQIPWLPSMNKSPDWIIPREPYRLWGDEKDYAFTTERVTEDYEKIIINSTDYIYPLDSAHPRIHRFRENKDFTTRNTYPQETYPITIYHLKK